jgi:hypothetical protein
MNILLGLTNTLLQEILEKYVLQLKKVGNEK